MGTEVLHPQNFWVERHPTSFHRRRNFPATGNLPNLIVNKKVNNNNNSHNKKTSPKHDRRKSPEPKNTSSSSSSTRSAAVVGQVTILKRGESLDSLTSKANPNPNPNKSVKSPNRKPVDDFALTGTGRIGPDSPNMLLKQIRLTGNGNGNGNRARSAPPVDIYAGSACALSPSPRAVPLPSFFNKKNENVDLASKDLRRLLRLE